MGYQESILQVNRKYQERFINALCIIHLKRWNSLADPDFVIEFKKDVTIDEENKIKIKKGEKLIYITGERSNQRSLESFLANMSDIEKVHKKLFFTYKIIPAEVCMDFIGEKLFCNIDTNDIKEEENEYVKITKFEIYQDKYMKRLANCFFGEREKVNFLSL